MLQAFIHNKCRLPVEDAFDGEMVFPHDKLFSLKEDTLTASVLGRFAYFPDETLVHVWQQIIDLGADFPGKKNFFLGHYESMAFWPSWAVPEGISGIRREPDAFVIFSNAVVVVEVKRFDFAMHSVDQWLDEVRAFHEEHGSFFGDRRLFLLALGGLGNRETAYRIEAVKRFAEKRTAATPILLSWRRLWSQILSNCPVCEQFERQVKAVLRDIEYALEMHGIPTARPKPLMELPEIAASFQTIPASLEQLPDLPSRNSAGLPDMEVFVKRAVRSPINPKALEAMPHDCQ